MIDKLFQKFRSVAAAPPPQAATTTAPPRPPYEAASTGRRTADWNAPDVSANLATAHAPTIRARARDTFRNDSIARAIVETKVDDVIGWGVKPMSRSRNEEFRQKVQALWDDWCAFADADGVLDLAGLQALAERIRLVDGECFVRLRLRRPEDRLPVPLQLQVLPAEICPAEYSATLENGNEIREGIEFDRLGRRVAYWMRDVPPGEDTSVATSTTFHRVPAGLVLHLFEPLRPGQRRGVSSLAPAMVRLRELDKFTDATLMRLQLSSMFVGTLHTTQQPNDLTHPLVGERLTETSQGRPVLRLEPGTFQELDPGEELEFNDPPDPPAGFTEFVRHEERAAGAALGVPLEVFMHDWGATNDRLARVVLNQYRRRVHRELWTIVVPQFLRPLWREWFDLALPSLPKLETYAEDRRGLVTFAPHAHAYVHPVQDVESYSRAIRAGLTSRAAAVAETGEDVELIDAQIAADNARADRLGLKLDTDPRPAPGGAK